MQLGMDFDISLEITGPDSVKSWSSSNTSIAKVHKNSDGSCTEKITYKSSNTKIATVSTKGVIKAKKKGTVTITVKSGDVKVRCRVTVK